MMYEKSPFIKNMYPWIVWLLAASFFYYKYLIQVSPGVMSTELMSAYSLTGAGLGNLAACFFYGYLLMQIPVGILLDKWSPGKITAIAAGFCALGVLLFAHTHALLTAGLSRFLMGLCASFAAVSCFKLASIWFPPKRFALVAGLSMTAAMLGAIGGQGPLSFLLETWGWRHALEWVALAGFILSFLIGIVIRDKKSTPEPELAVEDDTLTLKDKLHILLKDKQTIVIQWTCFCPRFRIWRSLGSFFFTKSIRTGCNVSGALCVFYFYWFCGGMSCNGVALRLYWP